MNNVLLLKTLALLFFSFLKVIAILIESKIINKNINKCTVKIPKNKSRLFLKYCLSKSNRKNDTNIHKYLRLSFALSENKITNLAKISSASL